MDSLGEGEAFKNHDSDHSVNSKEQKKKQEEGILEQKCSKEFHK